MKIHSFYSFSKLDVGSVLSSRAVARQVLSPLQGFTTVFGMGTGGLPAIGHQQTFRLLQVLSPLQGFTTVFGMGTGGLPAIGHQQTFRLLISFYSRPQLYAEDCIRYSSSITLILCLPSLFRLGNLRLLRRYRCVSSCTSLLSHYAFLRTLTCSRKSVPDCTPANAFQKKPSSD